jgi:hypothetical protein
MSNAQDIGLNGSDRIELIIDGRGRVGQVKDLVHFQINRIDNVVADQFEVVTIQEMTDILLGAGEEIIQAEDIVRILQQAFAEVGTEKSGTAGDQDAHFIPCLFRLFGLFGSSGPFGLFGEFGGSEVLYHT